MLLICDIAFWVTLSRAVAASMFACHTVWCAIVGRRSNDVRACVPRPAYVSDTRPVEACSSTCASCVRTAALWSESRVMML